MNTYQNAQRQSLSKSESTGRRVLRLGRENRPAGFTLVELLVVDESEITIDDGVWVPPLLMDKTKSPSLYNTTTPNQLSDRHERKKDKFSLESKGNCVFCDGHGEAIYREKAATRDYHDPLY